MMTYDMNIVLGNATLWLEEQAEKKRQDKKKFWQRLALCLILTVFVGVPVVVLAVQHAVEAKQCGDDIRCQF